MRSFPLYWGMMLLFAAGLPAGAGLAQKKTDNSRPPLVMRHADEFTISGEGTNEVYEAAGNVLFVQGDARITCTRAVFWRASETALFFGPVTIYDGIRTLKADRVQYDGRTRVEQAHGNVIMFDRNNSLAADHVRYDQRNETASADSNVVIRDLVERIILTGRSGIYRIAGQYGYIEGSARMVKADSSGSDSISVTGRFMEAWGDSGLVIVREQVTLEKHQLRAVCAGLFFYSDRDSLVLTGEPVVWQEDQKLTGDTVRIVLRDMQLKQGWINGNARIASIDTVKQNIMTGRNIQLSETADSVRHVIITGTASSVYHVEENEQGVNSFTGDTIIMTLVSQKLRRLVVESSPGKSRGTFVPARRDTGSAADTLNTSQLIAEEL